MSEIHSDVLSIIYNVFGSDSHNHSKSKYQISYNCPVCDDCGNKGNLEINYRKLVMKCWKCCDDEGGLSGSLRKLVKSYGSQRDLKLYDEITEDYTPEYIKTTYIENYKPNIKLPKETIIMSTAKRDHNFMEAYNYLKMRGLNDEIIAKYNLGYCTTGKYRGRIIIPSYDKDGDLNYFVARSYIGHKQTYDNPIVSKMEIIVNQLSINWDSTIYLVEGMFDMMGLGLDNTIPLLGKIMSEKLYYEILKRAKGYVVICLDPDAKLYAYRIYQRLQHSMELHDRVRVIDLPLNMDIAKIREVYGEKGVIKCLRKARKLTLEDFTKNGL